MSTGRWSPSTEANLKQAIDDGVFDEGHFFEVKQTVGDTKSERKETARDLASFAIDGGTVVIGFAEDKPNRKWIPAPVRLAEYAERVEQVAANRIDPPLPLRITEIPAAGQAGCGYLVVEVPASPAAPHMVDGAYYERGEKTRVRLRDAQVRRYHAAQKDREATIDRLLDEEISRDPIPAEHRAAAHLYLVAHPVAASMRIAQTVVYDDSMDLWQLIAAGEHLVPNRVGQIMPTASDANASARRANGVARCTGALRAGRTMPESTPDSENGLVDIEFRVDCGIRALVGALTRPRGLQETTPVFIVDRLAIGWALRLVYWTRMFVARFDFRGSWQFGIAATGLRGHSSIDHHWTGGPIYDRDTYRAFAEATYFDLHDQPHQVANTLVEPLLQALDTYEPNKSHLSGPDAAS